MIVSLNARNTGAHESMVAEERGSGRARQDGGQERENDAGGSARLAQPTVSRRVALLEDGPHEDPNAHS